MKRILFAEQFYYPEAWGGAELPRTLTAFLARQGYRVTVICGSDQYVPVDADPGPDPADSGVRVKRVPRLFGGRIHKRKLLKQFWFYICYVPLALLHGRPDAYIVQTNPPLVVVLTRLISLIMRRPMIIIAMDLYPEMLVRHGMIREQSIAGRLLTNMFSWAFKGAKRVVVLGPVMAERVLAKGASVENIVEIPNWATGELEIDKSPGNPFLAEWNVAGKFVFLYSGNLGIGHEFQTLIAAFRDACAVRDDIVLLFVGRGSRLADVQQLVREFKIEDNVFFFDYVPAEKLAYSMGVADVTVVTLGKGFEGLIVPSKALGYMGRGLPIIYVGPRSDISELVMKAGCGVIADNGDIPTVTDQILAFRDTPDRTRAIGAAGARFYFENLTAQSSLQKYLDVIAEIVGDPA